MAGKRFLSLALAGHLIALAGAAVASESTPTHEVVLASEVAWEPLNPARGASSPKAGTLWGDRNGMGPTGFLASFVDGFSSPPHIHNVTYRAVVISGLIHNDDPKAEKMWMPAGSFWTQPRGEVHITAAKGPTNVALVEIERAPYLVRGPEEGFDSGERPINVDASNIVWADQPGMPAIADGPKVAFLWGRPQHGGPNGTFVKLPAGFDAEIRSAGPTFRAVVIKGRPEYLGADRMSLEPGSYFGSKGAAVHRLSAGAAEASVIYISTDGSYRVTAAQPGK